MKQWLLGGLWAIFIIAASVVITLNFRPLYYWEMEQMELAERTAYTEQQIRENYDRTSGDRTGWKCRISPCRIPAASILRRSR